MTQEEAYARLNVSVDLIPSGSSNRPGARIQPTHITIHNTGNDAHGADALMHARYVKGADARARQVSWHFSVDDQRCVKHLPTTEKGWHAGPGNSRSIGIEICENQGIDHAAANERAALLTAILMLALSISPDKIVPHRFWTGKDCPHLVLRQEGGFEAFRSQAADFLAQLEESAPQVVAAAALAEDAAGGVEREELVDQLVLTSTSNSQFHSTSLLFATSDDRVSELERLVGRLTLENESLRRSLHNLQDYSFEAD